MAMAASTYHSAAVYVGPFMEVMMASSETKMVVGAACLEGNDSSATAFYMNNAVQRNDRFQRVHLTSMVASVV